MLQSYNLFKKNVQEFLNVKVNGTLNSAEFSIFFDSFIENLTSRIKLLKNVKKSSKCKISELSLKADGIRIFPLAK